MTWVNVCLSCVDYCMLSIIGCIAYWLRGANLISIKNGILQKHRKALKYVQHETFQKMTLFRTLDNLHVLYMFNVLIHATLSKWMTVNHKMKQKPSLYICWYFRYEFLDNMLVLFYVIFRTLIYVMQCQGQTLFSLPCLCLSVKK